MHSAEEVALYFLSKDKYYKLFNLNLIERNGRKFYEGNARLNKYLHIAQNVYIAMTGQKLINTDFYAYYNGAVAPEIQENYQLLRKKALKFKKYSFESKFKEYLDKIFLALKYASVDELIDISHEDIEWEKKYKFWSKEDQKMDSLRLKEEYKKQYSNFIFGLEKMGADE